MPFILRPAALLVAKCDCLWSLIDFSKGLKVCCSFKLLMGVLGLQYAHGCPCYRLDWKMGLIFFASKWFCLIRSPLSLLAACRSFGWFLHSALPAPAPLMTFWLHKFSPPVLNGEALTAARHKGWCKALNTCPACLSCGQRNPNREDIPVHM